MLLHILGFCTQKFKIGVMIMQFCGGYLATKTTTLNTPPTTPDEGDPNQPGQGEEDQGGSAD